MLVSGERITETEIVHQVVIRYTVAARTKVVGHGFLARIREVVLFGVVLTSTQEN